MIAQRMLVRMSLLIGCTTAGLVAQVPSHATRLNPTTGWYEPGLVRVGDTIHACGFVDGPAGLNWVHYARSDDGGKTWPVLEMPLALVREYDEIAAAGDLVVVLVKSQFFGPHTVTSIDGGVTWSLPVRVSQQSGFSNLFGARMHVEGTTVSVCWYEDRPGGHLWFNQSTDGGFTWRPVDQRLDLGITPGPLPMYGNSLNLAVDGNRLNVIWDPNGIPNGRLYQQRSLDGGLTWMPAARLIGPGMGGNFAADGATLFVAAGIGVTSTMWRSGDGGSTWAPVTNHGLQNPSLVAIAGSRVMLTTQSGSGLPITTSVATSQDGGQTWSATYGLVPSNQTVGGYPSVAGPDFYLHFRFFGSQPRAGFVLHNDGSSAQWRQLAADVGAGLFAWPEGCIATTVPPSPATELRAYVLAGHTSLGTGTPGTSGLTPKLAGTGLPLLSRSFFLDLEGARALAPGVLGVAFAPPTNVPFGAGTLHLPAPIVPFLFVTSNTGAGGTGTFTLPVTIPASATFVGMPFVSQAFVLDPLAANGFAMTRAIETWIR